MFEFRNQITADFFQMLGTSLFHFNLTVTVSGIHVIEYLLTALAGIVFDFAVQILIDVNQNIFFDYFQTKLINSGKLILVFNHTGSGFRECIRTE